MVRFIVVTGGVQSGIGKGITSSSLGTLLRAAEQDVVIAKVDPYLNEDAGTMSPYEHGECFVLDDGMEADLDLGNYERFLECSLTKASAITSGQIYRTVLDQERRGDYLGKTVQIVPHVTKVFCQRLNSLVDGHPDRIAIVEMGGTVGDIESEIFYHALRKMHRSLGREAFCHVHVSILTQTEGGELKTKPTQTSVQALNARGIIPDILCLRLPRGVIDLGPSERSKLEDFCGHSFLLLSPTCPSVYGVPQIFHEQGILDYFELSLRFPTILAPFKALASGKRDEGRKIMVIGKYLHKKGDKTCDSSDAYLSLRHALDHAALQVWGPGGSLPTIEWVDAEDVLGEKFWDTHEVPKAMILTGGFGSRAYDGFISGATRALHTKIPILGICLGFQMMVLALAKEEGIKDADTTERNPETEVPLIDIHEASSRDETKGGTLRRGIHAVFSTNPSMTHLALPTQERFRHRYHLNPAYLDSFSSRVQWDGEVEDLPGVPTRLWLHCKDHPFFLGTQAHCELTSRPACPSPYFTSLLQAMN